MQLTVLALVQVAAAGPAPRVFTPVSVAAACRDGAEEPIALRLYLGSCVPVAPGASALPGGEPVYLGFRCDALPDATFLVGRMKSPDPVAAVYYRDASTGSGATLTEGGPVPCDFVGLAWPAGGLAAPVPASYDSAYRWQYAQASGQRTANPDRWAGCASGLTPDRKPGFLQRTFPADPEMGAGAWDALTDVCGGKEARVAAASAAPAAPAAPSPSEPATAAVPVPRFALAPSGPGEFAARITFFLDATRAGQITIGRWTGDCSIEPSPTVKLPDGSVPRVVIACSDAGDFVRTAVAADATTISAWQSSYAEGGEATPFEKVKDISVPAGLAVSEIAW